MQLFSADAIVFSKKKNKFFLSFDPENIKKHPQKWLIINFFYVLARLPKRPRN